jgi:TPR repeat protein
MRNKSTFSVLMAGLLLMVAWCGTARADYGPWSDWVALNDGVQNACKASFRRSSNEVEVRLYNGYNLNVNIALQYRVVNTTDGSASPGTISATNLPPGQIYMSGGATQILGKNATTTAYSVPVNSYTIDLPLASNPNGAKYQIYPNNERAKQDATATSHEDLARRYLQQAREKRQQADQMRQTYLANQRTQAAQKQQQQERQRQIDAQKQQLANQMDESNRQFMQKQQQIQQTIDNINNNMSQNIQNAKDIRADENRASREITKQFENQKGENYEIQHLINAKETALRGALQHDTQARIFQGNANPAGPDIFSTLGAVYNQNKVDKNRDQANDERSFADQIDDLIADARRRYYSNSSYGIKDIPDDNAIASGQQKLQLGMKLVAALRDQGDNSFNAQDYQAAATYFYQANIKFNSLLAGITDPPEIQNQDVWDEIGYFGVSWTTKIGEYFEYGIGVPQDYVQAMQWYQKAADQGDIRGMTHFGYFYENGLGVSQDYGKAMELYQKAGDKDADALYQIGNLYANGHGVTQDYPQAMKWYQKAATMYHTGMIKDDQIKQVIKTNDDMLKLNIERLRDDRGERQYYLSVTRNYDIGMRYLYGNDYKHAMSYFKKAAANGDTEATYQIGSMYEMGLGQKQNYKKALECYQSAADDQKGANADAMDRIGWLYANGIGVQQDYAQALQWYQKAADGDNGNIDAMVNIGDLYSNGHGVTQDYTKALQWYEKAAGKESARAKYNIGMAFLNGQGVIKSPELAVICFKKAGVLGYQPALDALKKLGK